MDLIELRQKINAKYLKFLSKDDKELLANTDDDYLPLIVNRIWHNYLTDPANYKESQAFKFLVYDSSILEYPEPVKYEDLPVHQMVTHRLRILSSDHLLDEYHSRNGFIVEVDWEMADEVFLPDDLENKAELIRSSLKPLGTFVVSVGEGKISSEYALLTKMAEQTGLPFLDFNKRLYQLDYEFSKVECTQLINYVVVEYLVINNLWQYPKLRTSLVQKYLYDNGHDGQAIKLMLRSNPFPVAEFRAMMFGLLDQNEELNQYKMQTPIKKVV